jgi:hypothetical protein
MPHRKTLDFTAIKKNKATLTLLKTKCPKKEDTKTSDKRIGKRLTIKAHKII